MLARIRFIGAPFLLHLKFPYKSIFLITVNTYVWYIVFLVNDFFKINRFYFLYSTQVKNSLKFLHEFENRIYYAHWVISWNYILDYILRLYSGLYPDNWLYYKKLTKFPGENFTLATPIVECNIDRLIQSLDGLQTYMWKIKQSFKIHKCAFKMFITSFKYNVHFVSSIIVFLEKLAHKYIN